MDSISIFLGLLLLGAIWESSSITRATLNNIPTVASIFKTRNARTTTNHQNNHTLETPWQPILPQPIYKTVLNSNAEIISSSSNIAYNPKKFYDLNRRVMHSGVSIVPRKPQQSETAINRKKSKNIGNNYAPYHIDPVNYRKFDNLGQSMGYKKFNEGSNYQKRRDQNIAETYGPKYEDIMTRLNAESIQGIPLRSPNFKQHYSKPYDATKSMEFSPSFAPKIKPYPTSQYQTGAEFPGGIRPVENKPSAFGNLDKIKPPSLPNFGKIGYTAAPNNAAYYPLTDGKVQTLILPKYNLANTAKNSHQLRAGNFNTNLPNSGGAKQHESYQLLSTQPQLHFQGVVNQNSPIYHSQPFEKIRADVEVINKKRPIPLPHDDGDEFEDDGGSREFVQPSFMQGMNPYEMPDSNIFNAYDQAFGNPFIRVPNIPADKPVDEKVVESPQFIEPDNNSKEGDKYVPEYESDDSTSGSHEKYEEDEDAENQENEKPSPENEEKSIEEGSSNRKKYNYNFEQEFDDSYLKELPKRDFKHVKEVPEIGESTNNQKILPSSKYSYQSSRRTKKHDMSTNIQQKPTEHDNYVKTYLCDESIRERDVSHASTQLCQQSHPSQKLQVFGSRIIKKRPILKDHFNVAISNKSESKIYNTHSNSDESKKSIVNSFPDSYKSRKRTDIKPVKRNPIIPSAIGASNIDIKQKSLYGDLRPPLRLAYPEYYNGRK